MSSANAAPGENGTVFYPLDSIILETRSGFYQALFEAHDDWYKPTEEATPWVAYYSDAVFTQWMRAERCLRDRQAIGY